MRSKADFVRDFPNLRDTAFEITHPASESYNCIAWSIGECRTNYWPFRQYNLYWPRRIPFELSLNAFTQFYRIEGFELCDSSNLEKDWEKVALYALNGFPTHAVRQLPTGRWTSKMGHDEVLEIQNPTVLEGADYGHVALYFKRKRSV